MGHLLTSDGIKPDPDKVSAIQDMPMPANVAAIQDMPIPANVAAIQRFNGTVTYLSKFLHHL